MVLGEGHTVPNSQVLHKNLGHKPELRKNSKTSINQFSIQNKIILLFFNVPKEFFEPHIWTFWFVQLIAFKGRRNNENKGTFQKKSIKWNSKAFWGYECWTLHFRESATVLVLALLFGNEGTLMRLKKWCSGRCSAHYMIFLP